MADFDWRMLRNYLTDFSEIGRGDLCYLGQSSIIFLDFSVSLISRRKLFFYQSKGKLTPARWTSAPRFFDRFFLNLQSLFRRLKEKGINTTRPI